MKYVFATCLVVLAANYAQASQKWTCDDGDYHLSLQLDKGAAVFQYQICEFAECAELNRVATLSFESSRANQFLYAIVGPTSAENMILSFASKNQLAQVDIESDSINIQSFNNCRKSN